MLLESLDLANNLTELPFLASPQFVLLAVLKDFFSFPFRFNPELELWNLNLIEAVLKILGKDLNFKTSFSGGFYFL